MRRLATRFARGLRSSSPDQVMAPWFGGRIEVAHHGFAISFPPGWVAFDLTADIGSQVRAARACLPDLPATDTVGLPMRLVQDRADGALILALDFMSTDRGVKGRTARPRSHGGDDQTKPSIHGDLFMAILSHRYRLVGHPHENRRSGRL